MAMDLDRKTRLYGIPGAGVETVFVRVVKTDLVPGNLYMFHHKLDCKYPVIVVYDDTDKQIVPDFCTIIDDNHCVLDFTSFMGIWPAGAYYKVRAVGG
jgi:hypothetical protein